MSPRTYCVVKKQQPHSFGGVVGGVLNLHTHEEPMTVMFLQIKNSPQPSRKLWGCYLLWRGEWSKGSLADSSWSDCSNQSNFYNLSPPHHPIGRLSLEVNEAEMELLNKYLLPSVCKCLEDTRYSAVRNKALQTIDKVIRYLQGMYIFILSRHCPIFT